jgi:hypothetical protein
MSSPTPMEEAPAMAAENRARREPMIVRQRKDAGPRLFCIRYAARYRRFGSDGCFWASGHQHSITMDRRMSPAGARQSVVVCSPTNKEFSKTFSLDREITFCQIQDEEDEHRQDSEKSDAESGAPPRLKACRSLISEAPGQR